MAKIAVRYIGEHAVRLLAHQGTFYDGSGSPLTSNILTPGDTLMLNEEEVLGQTFIEDQRGSGQLRSLGAGHIVLPEHSGVPEEDLAQYGYRFHAGRTDFTPVKALPATTKSKKTANESAQEAKQLAESADMLIDAPLAQEG